MLRKIFYCMIMVFVIAGSNVFAQKAKEYEETACPVCSAKKLVFTVIDLREDTPAKLQYIVSLTDSPGAIYSCANCCFTCFAEDIRSIPKGKIETLRELLKKIKEEKKEGGPSMAEKMLFIENVYLTLKKDDVSWGKLYRLIGYYCGKERKNEEADSARKKALAAVERLIKNPDNAGKYKELVFISGSMKHYLRDEKGSINDLNEVLRLRYENSKLPKDKEKEMNEYLDGLTIDFIENIRKKASITNVLYVLIIVLVLLAVIIAYRIFRRITSPAIPKNIIRP